MRTESAPVFRRLWPLYLGEWFVLLAVVLALRGTVGPDFPLLAFALCAILACSLGFFLRHLGLDNETGIYALLLLAALFWFITPLRHAIGQYITPPGADVDLGVAIGSTLLCLSIGLAAVATTDSAVAFVVVPGLSAFGTCGDMVSSPSFLAAFLLFVHSSVFVLAYQHILSKTAHSKGRVNPPQGARRALLFASLFSLLVFLTAGLGTKIVGPFGYRANASATNPSLGLFPHLPLGMSVSPLEPLNLGSAVPPQGEREAFRVVSDVPLLWRIGVYNDYDGQSWRVLPPPQSRRRIANPANFADLLSDLPATGSLLHQTYQIRSLVSDGVVAAANPVRVQGIPQTLALDVFGCIHGRTPTYPGATYIVSSIVPIASAWQLRQVTLQYPDALADSYLRLPQSAYRVSEIARRVAGNTTNPYDKVMALQHYLERNFKYTLRPPAPPHNEDFVTWFLTDAKVGYCEAFASALAVMARSIGIPARLATGFAPGEFDLTSSTFIVREKDAHAWTEIYFGSDFGWLPFDPQPAEVQAPARSRKPLLGSIGPGSLELPSFVVVTFIALCALVLLAGPPLAKAFATRRPGPLLASPPDDRHRICQAYASMCASLAALGISRAPSQTPLEYASLLSKRLRYTTLDILSPIRQLTNLFLLACYSSTSPTSDDLQAVSTSLQTVRRSVRLLRPRRRGISQPH